MALAIMAAIMVFARLRSLHKAFYFLLLGWLCLIENRANTQAAKNAEDRLTAIQQRVEISITQNKQNFDAVSGTLSDSIAKIQGVSGDLQASIKQNKKDFQATMVPLRENLRGTQTMLKVTPAPLKQRALKLAQELQAFGAERRANWRRANPDSDLPLAENAPYQAEAKKYADRTNFLYQRDYKDAVEIIVKELRVQHVFNYSRCSGQRFDETAIVECAGAIRIAASHLPD